jgi:ABC-2 type transport system permease protein
LQIGTLDGFLRTPIRRWSIIGGKIASDAVRMLIQATVVVGLSIPLGAHLTDAARAGAGVLLIVGLGMAVAGLSNVIALRTRSAEVISALANLVLLPVMFLSTAYMPRTLLPRWLQLAASANPLTYVIEGARRLLTGASDAPHIDLLIGVAVVTVVAWVGVAGSTRAFRKATA